MLIALYLWLTVGFGGPATLEDRVEASVVDPVRLEAALVVVERVEALQRRLEQETQRAAKALRETHARHDATRADYLAVLEPLARTRREVYAGCLEARADLREILTRSEWIEVFPPEE